MSKRVKKSSIVLFFFILSVIAIIPFGTKFSSQNFAYNDRYNDGLNRLKNTNEVINYVDSLYNIKLEGGFYDTVKYLSVLNDVLKQRFYYGISRYSISENWIAHFAGKFFWSHLSAIVEPEDILKHNEGLCSQQTIVFLSILKKKGIKFRSVGLGQKEGPGHFLCEVFHNGNWHLYDITLEPNWNLVGKKQKDMTYYLSNRDSLYVAYKGKLSKENFNKILNKVEYGLPNQMPAKNMLLFHKMSKVLTYLIPLILLILFFWRFKKNRTN